MRKQISYVNSLPENIRESLAWYTGGAFDTLNERLRKGKGLGSMQAEHLHRIDLAFSGAPALENPITVYKGKNSMSVYSDKAFISTSVEYDKALDFAGSKCCILEITVAPGSKVLPIFGLSRYQEEGEVLLDRDGELTATYVGAKGDMKVIKCVYLPRTGISIEKGVDIKEAEKELQTDNSETEIINRIVGMFEPDELEFLDDIEDEVKIIAKKLGLKVSRKMMDDILKVLGR
jgi:hypothetical protein